MNARWPKIALISLATALAASGFELHRLVRFESQSDELSEAVRDAKRADAEFLAELLLVAAARVQNFDGLVRYNRAMHEAVATIDRLVSSLGSGRTVDRRDVERLQAGLEDRDTYVDDYLAAHAIATNGRKALPTLVQRAMPYLAQGERLNLQVLYGQVLLTSLASEKFDVKRQAVEFDRAKFASSPKAEPFIAAVIRQGAALVEAEKRSRFLLDSVLALPLERQLTDLDTKDRALLAVIRSHRKSLTLLLFLLASLLLGLTMATLVKLERLNRSLETQVAARTAELHLRQQSLAQSQKLAALGQMAGGVAHEINNPLAVISGRASQIRRLLGRGQTDALVLQGLASTIEGMVERISQIVRGLQAVSRSGSDDPVEVARVAAIVDQTFAICAERFDRHKVELIRPKDLGDVELHCRPTEISQILLNLLNNALDAVALLDERWVRLEVSHQDGEVQFVCTDSGTGLTPEALPKILEPFFTTKDVGKGTGLGLSITKGIVDRHGGKFELRNEQGHTQFVVRLPQVTHVATA